MGRWTSEGCVSLETMWKPCETCTWIVGWCTPKPFVKLKCKFEGENNKKEEELECAP